MFYKQKSQVCAAGLIRHAAFRYSTVIPRRKDLEKKLHAASSVFDLRFSTRAPRKSVGKYVIENLPCSAGRLSPMRSQATFFRIDYNRSRCEQGSLCAPESPRQSLRPPACLPREEGNPSRRHQGALHVPPSVQLWSLFRARSGNRLISGRLIPSPCARMTCKEWNPQEHLGSVPWQRIAISARSASSRSSCEAREAAERG